ncbi:hypothetical protein [Pseudomonas fluorescens]|uniref:Uncharacterized protein n=1 Tax=Pseudomonas fluorescens TaxID=294 RepID=A0A5E7A032_PSEFL|nr:hypothetical protein [Pseudomonas fluorescens]VVN71405.1 hypothetical protein PS710_00453 [Pseudomonas fluorescens]
MKDLSEKMAAGGPLVQQALQALLRYNEAKGVKPAGEVERLRLDAESLTAGVHEYHRRILSEPVSPLH